MIEIIPPLFVCVLLFKKSDDVAVQRAIRPGHGVHAGRVVAPSSARPFGYYDLQAERLILCDYMRNFNSSELLLDQNDLIVQRVS